MFIKHICISFIDEPYDSDPHDSLYIHYDTF